LAAVRVAVEPAMVVASAVAINQSVLSVCVIP
jgi:hypothetical protein